MAVLVSLTLFMGGCSLVKLKTSAEPTESPGFSDEEIKAFMEGSEVYEEEQDGRPVWAYTKHKNRPFKNYIARIGYGKIGNKSKDVVEDSLRRKLQDLMAENVETRVTVVIEDSVKNIIKQYGKQQESIREHVLSVISRHYTPEIIFNGEYDETRTYENDDTLWYYIKFSKTKYIHDQKQRFFEEIRKAGEEAYRYLSTSLGYLSEKSNMANALAVLGLASYHISRGGGSAYNDDLFNLGSGKQQNLLVQRRALITEIKNNIGIKLRNKDEKIVARDKPFIARIFTHRNTKDYDLNSVKLRIRTDTDVLNFPKTVNLEPDGSAEIPFSSNTDVYGKTVPVSVTFDVISELIDDKEWYKTDDYSDLLKELPRIEFMITTEEFTPIETWAFVYSDIPSELNVESDLLQTTLEKELSNYSDFLKVIPRKNLPIDYKKVQAFKSGKTSSQSLGKDLQEVQNHDLDIMLKINYDAAAMSYTMMLEGTGPAEGAGGIISAQKDTVSEGAINKTIGIIVERFVAKYFYRKIELEKPVKSDIDIVVNGEKITPKEISGNLVEIPELSRFETQEIIAKSSGFRKQVFPIPGEPFSFQMTPRPRSSIQMDQLALEHGTLEVSVVDKSTGDPIQYVENIDKSTFFNMFRGGERGLGKPPKIKVRQLWFGFIPNPFYSMVSNTSDRASFSINKPSSVHNIFNFSYVSPKYSVKVSKQFYNPPLLPTIVRVYDDKDPLSKESNYISIPLLKKDKKVAMVRSVIFPGLGHLTLGKNKEGLSFFSSALVTVLGGAYQNNKFKNEVESYNHLKDDYLTAPEENWTAYEHDLNQSKGRIKDHRFWVDMSIVTYVAILGFNLLTVTL